jgi:hypothetical protein
MWLLIIDEQRTAAESFFWGGGGGKVGNYNVAAALKLFLSTDLMRQLVNHDQFWRRFDINVPKNFIWNSFPFMLINSVAETHT